LLLRHRRTHFRDYPGLQWGAPQIAHDVIRLKCRLLLDFLSPLRQAQGDDIILQDFANLVSGQLDQSELEEMGGFIEKVNKWTVHLSWMRTTGEEYSRRDRELMEEYAMKLLGTVSRFIKECVANGVQLHGRAKAHYDNFARIHSYLTQAPRVEEGKEKRPSV